MSDLRICRVAVKLSLKPLKPKLFNKAFSYALAERPSDVPLQSTNEMTFGAADS
jgi:hypothetical protein